MGLRINTNIASLMAQRHLAETTRRLEGNLRRLATGRRISTSSDDPAGLAISERLLAQIKSLQKAKRNSEDGISLAEIAEGGLEAIGTALTRARELAVQAGNGTLQGSDKDALQAELAELVAHIDRVANSTSYSATILLNGSHASVTLQTGAGTIFGVDTFGVSLSSVLSHALGIDSLNIGAVGDPHAAITALDSAVTTISSRRAYFGAVENTLNATISSLDSQIENLTAANSRIVDVDLAAETADLVKNQILQQAGIMVLAQANAQANIALRLLQNLT